MTKDQFLEAYKHRSYLHFDVPFASPAAAWDFVCDFKEGILYGSPPRKHGFHPFIGFTLSTLKIQREDKPGIPRRLRRIIYKNKLRPIKIASHKDAAIYSYYGKTLSDLYETRLADLNLTEVPTAFRKIPGGKSNIDHAKEIFDFVEQNRPCVALAFDVEKFFDTLSHRKLRAAWADVLGCDRLPPDHYRVYRSLTRFAWVSRKAAYDEFGISEHNPKLREPNPRRSRICSPEEFRQHIREAGLIQHNPESDKGIPQGSPMSAVLSNIYMLPVDRIMHTWATSLGGLYRRYCDDIIVVIPPEHTEATEHLMHALIGHECLRLNTGKTERVVFGGPIGSVAAEDKKLQYLGFTFDGGTIRLRQSSLDRYYGKMRNGVNQAVKCQGKQIRKAGYQRLKTRKLLLKYSHQVRRQRGDKRLLLEDRRKYLSKRSNFISYGLRASKKLDSSAIRNQIRAHWGKLWKQIRSKEIQP
jgi:hypothetical protein